MAYNRANRLKSVRRIIEIYNEVKKPELPDTQIVRIYFPQHQIFISYRTWMTIKNMKRSEYMQTQPSLFDQPAALTSSKLVSKVA